MKSIVQKSLKAAFLLSFAVSANLQCGFTDLMDAVCEENIEKVSNLIPVSDVNEQDEDGITALMCASQNGSQNIAQLLLNAGADMEIRDNEGYTALLYAFLSKKPELIRFLINKGANITAKDNKHQGLEYYAQYSPDTETKALAHYYHKLAEQQKLKAIEDKLKAALTLATQASDGSDTDSSSSASHPQGSSSLDAIHNLADALIDVQIG